MWIFANISRAGVFHVRNAREDNEKWDGGIVLLSFDVSIKVTSDDVD